MFSFSFILFSYLIFSYYLAVKINKERYLTLWLITFLVSTLLSVELLGVFNVFSVIGLKISALLLLLLVAILEIHNFKKFGTINLKIFSQTHKITSSFFLILFFTITVVLFAEFLPIYEIDSIAYHLPIVSELISSGSVWSVFHAGFVGPNTFFPANHEAIQAFFAIQNGNINFGYVVTFLSFLLLYTSLLDLTHKRVSNLFVLVITFASISTPFLFNQFSNLQIDLFMFSFFGSAIALMISSIVNNDKFDLAKGFLILGIMLGSKVNAVPQILVLVPFIIFIFYYHRKALKSVFWHPLVMLLPGVFWYIRNWIIAGNPIYPFGINLGFINFEGHQNFTNATINTPLWHFIAKDGITNVISHIFKNDQFEIQLGKASLLPFAVALLAVIGILISFLYKKIKNKKNNPDLKWPFLIFISLVYIFFAELFYYLNSPYTYTLWHQTIRYASPIFALLPVFFILTAFYSRIIYFLLFYFSAGLLIYNILLKSFLFDAEILQLIHHKVVLIPDIYILLLIGIVLLIIVLFGFLIRVKKQNSIAAFFVLLIISFAISTYQFKLSPYFIKNTEFDDVFLSEKLKVYQSILPHIEKLREIKINGENPAKIALSGLTPYWLFQKEGYIPVYVNVDGCIECQYFYYRNEEKSIRAFPDQDKWETALKGLNVKYLIVDFKSYGEHASYEEEWAKNNKKMFTLLLKMDSISLYGIN